MNAMARRKYSTVITRTAKLLSQNCDDERHGRRVTVVMLMTRFAQDSRLVRNEEIEALSLEESSTTTVSTVERPLAREQPVTIYTTAIFDL